MDEEKCFGKNRDKSGPCLNRSMRGKKYCNSCEILYGNTASNRIKSYKMGIWQQRMEELSDSSDVKSLADEVIIAKMTLETIYKCCQTENDVLLNAHKISDLMAKIDKLVNSCHKLQRSSGQLLDKSSVLQIAGEIITIISNHVKDTELVETIAGEIIEAIAKASNHEEYEE